HARVTKRGSVAPRGGLTVLAPPRTCERAGAVTAEQGRAPLKDLKGPSSGRPMAELGYFKHPEILDGGGVRVRVELPTPASPHKARIEEGVRATLSPLQIPRVEVAFAANVRPSPGKQNNPNDLVPSVKN